ncbi:MAG: NYN domain-containing protein, partial [Candidatus Muiribacteriota bacterium]
MEKVAFFIDWENFKQDVYAVQKSTGFRVFNFNDPSALVRLFKGFLEPDEKIYRIFFYTSFPFNPTELYKSVTERKTLSEYQINRFKTYFESNEKEMKQFYDENSNFLNKLSYEEHIALRVGDLKINGFNYDGSVIFVQKQVDMILGLDIAHVSYRQLVDKVIIFSKDTDVKPALKSARLTGVETLVGNLEGSHKIPDLLRKHADGIRSRNIQEIFKENYNRLVKINHEKEKLYKKEEKTAKKEESADKKEESTVKKEESTVKKEEKKDKTDKKEQKPE